MQVLSLSGLARSLPGVATFADPTPGFLDTFVAAVGPTGASPATVPASAIPASASPASAIPASAIPTSAGSVSPATEPMRSASQPVPPSLLMEEPDWLPVPETRQSTDYSCGASALQAVLMYWGEEFMESELMAMCHTDPTNGTNPRDIVRVARELGFTAELRENLTLADLKASLEEGVPVIIACQAWREGEDLNKPWSEVWQSGHYMVVIGMDAHNVYFEDPSLLGSKGVISRPEFEERWHDVDERPYLQSGIFIRGEHPKPPPDVAYVA